MKKVELYQCEVCGTQYKHKGECEECEKKHVRYTRITGAKYNAQNVGSNDGLPVKVTIQFENGKSADYRR